MGPLEGDAHDLAHQLAKLRGSSATAAVREALEEALAAERRGRANLGEVFGRLQERAAATKAVWLTEEDLYDEAGPPR